VIEGGDCGIDFDEKTGIFTFYVRKYLEDLKFAVNQYICGLDADLVQARIKKNTRWLCLQRH